MLQTLKLRADSHDSLADSLADSLRLPPLRRNYAVTPPQPTPRRPPHSAVAATPRQVRSQRGGVRRWRSQPTRRRPPARSAAATAARSLDACSLKRRSLARRMKPRRSLRSAAAAFALATLGGGGLASLRSARQYRLH